MVRAELATPPLCRLRTNPANPIRSLTLPFNQATKAEQLGSMHLAPVLSGAGQVLGACEAPELLTTSR